MLPAVPHEVQIHGTKAEEASSVDISSFFNYVDGHDDTSSSLQLPLMPRRRKKPRKKSTSIIIFASSILSSLAPAVQSLLFPSCHCPSMHAIVPKPMSPSRRKVAVTFFGQKKGRVSFAVQEDTKSEPVLLLELATPTNQLVKEMASGMVRILLECERSNSVVPGSNKRLSMWEEPVWTMYCNGHRRGYAASRGCGVSDMHVLRALQAVSVGAGVLPAATQPHRKPLPATSHPLEMFEESCKDCSCMVDGRCEVMYMRARFERVVGSKDSEAYYMISPDCARGKKYDNGGPELSVFLLRL